MIDIILENRISCVIAVYHQIVVEALEAALEKRKVAFINISPFFVKNDEQKDNQQTIVDELAEFGKLYDDESGQRNQAHLILGILNYSEFTSNFKVVKQSKAFENLQK